VKTENNYCSKEPFETVNITRRWYLSLSGSSSWPDSAVQWAVVSWQNVVAVAMQL